MPLIKVPGRVFENEAVRTDGIRVIEQKSGLSFS
jgi:hypothetical protein